MRVRARKFTAAAGVIAVTLVCAATASANRVLYLEQLTPHRFLSLKLVGDDCPKGPHCFDAARVISFQVFYTYPGCPGVDTVIDFDNINKHGVPVHKQDHSFSGSGVQDGQIHFTFEGRFIHHGFRAEGTYKIDELGCTTGLRHWSAPLDTGP